jgi:hypothetical protein
MKITKNWLSQTLKKENKMKQNRKYFTAVASNICFYMELGVVAVSEEDAIKCFKRFLGGREMKRHAKEEYIYAAAIFDKVDKNDYFYSLDSNINESLDCGDFFDIYTIDGVEKKEKKRLHKVKFINSGANG